MTKRNTTPRAKISDLLLYYYSIYSGARYNKLSNTLGGKLSNESLKSGNFFYPE